MAKRTCREFSATMEQQMKQFKPVRVNPFPLMMDAARQHQAQQHAQAQQASSSAAAVAPGNTHSSCAGTQRGTGAAQQPSPCIMCSHCGTGLSELQVQQCHACKAVYCSSCSVINYDEREDRIFCLDCNTDSMQLASYCEVLGPDGVEEAHGVGGPHTSTCFNPCYQQLSYCSPQHRDIIGSASASAAAALSAERRGSVMRACSLAAAAAAAAADSGGSCLAGMSSISGLPREQMTPMFAQGGMLCSGGNGSGYGSHHATAAAAAAVKVAGVGGGGVGVLQQWDLNSSMLSHHHLPFTAGY